MILLVEDDPIIVEGLLLTMRQEGFEMLTAQSKGEATDLWARFHEQIELCLLDITLPDGTGYEICEFIRQTSDVPVLFLTAMDDEIHTVLALENGADDYITKPFHIRELVARMKAVLRRSGTAVNRNVRRVKDNVIDLSSAKVYRGNEEVVLSAMEYKLLLIMLSHQGQVLTRRQILDILWDDAGAFVEDNTLTVYIRRLRNKLDDAEGEWIETVRGMGYRLRRDV
ncbi:MAG: response regulator transcription factor [Solobacterium sp.]|nr:response regulator transcription factor [Solobacterium sp.]